jgi:RimJ/RimL family protein N-acetyltransferase
MGLHLRHEALIQADVIATFPERIGTERLVLRRLTDADDGAFTAIWDEPEVQASLNPGRALPPGHARRRLDHHASHWDEHGFGLLMAGERESGETIGWVGPSRPDFIPALASEIELGWTLRRAWWGRGLASEGAEATLAEIERTLSPPRTISLIHPDNERSLAVARRLGMSDSGEALHPGIGTYVRVYAR